MYIELTPEQRSLQSELRLTPLQGGDGFYLAHGGKHPPALFAGQTHRLAIGLITQLTHSFSKIPPSHNRNNCPYRKKSRVQKATFSF